MAWTAIGPSFASAQALRNASAAAGLQLGGRHIWGELAKIWIPSQPISTALLGMPLSPPPETCAPRRTAGVGVWVDGASAESVSDIVIWELQARTDVRSGRHCSMQASARAGPRLRPARRRRVWAFERGRG